MNKCSYLLNIADLLPSGHDAKKLKSLYRCKSRYLQETQSETAPFLVNYCPKCSIQFSEQRPSYRIHGIKRSRFRNRLKKKAKKNVELTKFQKKYLQHMKNTDKFMTITCNFCKNRIKKYFGKPKKQIVKQEVVQTPVRKKSKKKKDMFSGLNKQAVLSVQELTSALNKNPKMNNNIHNITKTGSKRKNSDSFRINKTPEKRKSTHSDSLQTFLQNL